MLEYVHQLFGRLAKRVRGGYIPSEAEVERRLEQLVDVPCPSCDADITLAEIDDVGEIETCTACDTQWLVTKRPGDPHKLHLVPLKSDVYCPSCRLPLPIALDQIGDTAKMVACPCDMAWLITKWQHGPNGLDRLHIVEFRQEAHARTS